MNQFEKYDCENSKPLELIGEQINLTSRSDRSVSGSSSNRRPQSAAHYSSWAHVDCRANSERPKSAEFNNFNYSSRRSPFQWPYNIIDHKVDEVRPISVSHFTDSSSKLLQNLLETPREHLVNDVTPHVESVEKDSKNLYKEETLDNLSGAEKNPNNSSPNCLNFEANFLQKNSDHEVKEGNLKIQQWLPEVDEEKTVRFVGSHEEMEGEREKVLNHGERCHKREPVHHHCHHMGRCKLHFCRRKDSESPREVPHICRSLQRSTTEGIHNKTGHEPRGRVGFVDDTNTEGIHKPLILPEMYEDDKNKAHDTWLNFEKTLEGDTEFLSASKDLSADYFNKESGFREKLENLIEDNSSDEVSESRKLEEKFNQVEGTEKPDSSFPRVTSDSTYEEMVRLLQTLEEEDSESLNLEEKQDSRATSPPGVVAAEERMDHLSAVYSYLEEVEKEDNNFDRKDKDLKECTKNFSSPRLEELLNKNSVELSHEVLSLKIQVEDQRKGIKLLRETLAEMKEERRTADIEHQEALHKANAEAEALVQRHQKFIKQLLNEKKNLNETVSKLVEDLKSGEERYKRNIKALEEKHVIEVKRAKEAQAVADKIKRDKWMESKTLKIKEMTVKGLEPELSRMAVRQQEEMTELRNLHRAELEAVELRAARRTSELMDELRAELTKEKEHAIARETTALRASMEKEFEEERIKLQNCCQTLKDRLRREEEKLSNREMEFHQKLIDFKQETEKERQKMVRDHQEKMEEIRRRHSVELKNLRESLDAEKEIWMNNYKKQQAAKFFEKETELHQQYKRERDRDIEMIIETLEKESAQIQLELNLAAENKLKRLKDKLESEIKEMEASEAALKEKLSDAKSQLLAREDFITELNSQIRQLQTEITFLRKSCEEMSLERGNLKELIRGEFESRLGEAAKEKESLEREMTALKESHLQELSKKDQLNLRAKNEMQKELARVYTRFKAALNKKDKMIESLKEEIGGSNQRCQQLELMLDRQRRNLLL